MVIRGHGAKMNRLWLPAIRALLTSDTIQEAAERVGVHRNTLGDWLQDKDFADSYEEARKHRQAALLKEFAGTVAFESPQPAA